MTFRDKRRRLWNRERSVHHLIKKNSSIGSRALQISMPDFRLSRCGCRQHVIAGKMPEHLFRKP